jgi:4-hydroxybenzoate polyprenyltransferase
MPAVASFCVTAVQLYLAQGLRPLTTLMVAALTLFIYALNGFSDHAEDAANDPARALMLRRSAAWTLGLASVVMLSAGVLLALRGRLHLSYGAIAFVGVAYSFRVIPYLRGGSLEWLRLKDVALLKNLTIAMTWAAAVFLVPVLDAGQEWRFSSGLTFVALTYLLLVAHNSLFCDVRDEPGDREAGVRTLPVVLGAQRCFALTFVLAMAWSVGLVLGFASEFIDGPTTSFLLLVNLGYPAFVWWANERRSLQRDLEKALIESSDVVFAAGLILLSLLTSRT